MSVVSSLADFSIQYSSVVAIHGLHGHSRKSWVTKSDAEQIWLRDAFTAKSSKVARVIMYGYDAMESSGSCFTSRGIHMEAEALLAQLLVLRNESVTVSFPVSSLRY